MITNIQVVCFAVLVDLPLHLLQSLCSIAQLAIDFLDRIRITNHVAQPAEPDQPDD